ncbi:M56 family metallopeptidase [Amycolatopsis tucumanensis]|uniref:M56 family metallopeptidase n=1 Tax=Amycolatopsis tucumanensis TaxID=401106 RepID=A0ABP7JX16_9PSEU|nr:M56 family metallopeptidase [Amycolatopsis tucumanensis]MCF6429174.1 M56 family metallopeptidase [Amycolatopsis tucumanensis]
MIVAIALLLGAVVAGWLVPRGLRRADLRQRDPRTLISAWLLSMGGVLLAGTVGILLLFVPEHGAAGSLASALTGCWTALQHGTSPRLEELGGALSAVLLLAGAIRLAVVGLGEIRRVRRARRHHLDLLRLAGRADTGKPPTVWLAHDEPMAFSIAGRPGVIVATDGLTRHLPAACAAAVLAHEHAHLRGRHHLLVGIADVLRRTVPFVALFRQAPAAIRDLVELSADEAAARRHGPTAVRAALLGVAGHGIPDGALAMAGEAVALRLARLDTWNGSGSARRALTCGAAAIAATTLPFVAGAALLLTAAIAACPIGLQ